MKAEEVLKLLIRIAKQFVALGEQLIKEKK